MAGHLLTAGHDLAVWNRTAEKTDPLRAQGATVASSPEELAANCDIVFLCVNRTEDVQECVHALARGGQRGLIIVDHSTILPSAAKQLYEEIKPQGFHFVDAPITGGSMGAQKGQLTVFCGGDEDVIAQVVPNLAYAKRAERVGGSGAGQMMKMVNQIAVANSLLGLCEAMSFAKKAGLDLAQTKELVGAGAAGSWAFDNYGPKILAEDWSPGFKITSQRKDPDYCERTAQEIGAAVPGTALVDTLLALSEQDGLGQSTTAALFQTLLKLTFDEAEVIERGLDQ